MIEVTATISLAAGSGQRANQWRRASSIGSKGSCEGDTSGECRIPAGVSATAGDRSEGSAAAQQRLQRRRRGHLAERRDAELAEQLLFAPGHPADRLQLF